MTSGPIRCRRSSPATAQRWRKSFHQKAIAIDINIDQVPVHVRHAVMAAEDRDFYSNPGFSFTGFARAFKNNIFGGDTQGGSTITQQYVKNALVGSRDPGIGGLVRKAKELVIATKMSREWSKDASAAVLSEHHLLRSRHLRHLGGLQGLLRQTRRATHCRRGRAAGRADPAPVDAGSRRRSPGRRGTVELGARRHGRHRRAVAERSGGPGVSADRPARCRPVRRTRPAGPNGLIERQVTKELLDLFNIDEQTLNTQGLQVTTTIDPQGAEGRRERRYRSTCEGQDPDMRTAVVSIDPKTAR